MHTERGGPPAPGPGVTAQGTNSENDMQFETRVTAITVCHKCAPLFSESATLIEIVDHAAGEFVKVSQSVLGGAEKISISPAEWPHIRDAIAKLVGECRPCD